MLSKKTKLIFNKWDMLNETETDVGNIFFPCGGSIKLTFSFQENQSGVFYLQNSIL